MYQLYYVKLYSTNQDGNLLMLDDLGRVRSKTTSVVCQIQRFDFDRNLVVVRKVIIGLPLGLGLKPLYGSTHRLLLHVLYFPIKNCQNRFLSFIQCNEVPVVTRNSYHIGVYI